MIRGVLLAALLALLPAQAHANVWSNAIARGAPDAAQEVYDHELRSGDELAMQAATHTISFDSARRLAKLAATSYRNAAAAKPNEAEPYYRLGRLLYALYFECTDSIGLPSPSLLCNPIGFDRTRAEETIAAWDAFEARAPLDPRLGVTLGESDILFSRAILHTKIATKEHLEQAARDYEKILQRSDIGDANAMEVVWGNLAETYMMLDRLDEAVDAYREALRRGAQTATLYGLAVALDRDERTEQAKALIVSQGEVSLEAFAQSVVSGRTFFVPHGEEYYYFALAAEAFDRIDEAIANWDNFIRSGAHAEFQGRARAHLDALHAKLRRKAVPIDTPWQRILP